MFNGNFLSVQPQLLIAIHSTSLKFKKILHALVNKSLMIKSPDCSEEVVKMNCCTIFYQNEATDKRKRIGIFGYNILTKERLD
jgi:hypothetical protein